MPKRSTHTDVVPAGSMRQIWRGNIKVERHAWELLYHIDEIHQWAKTTYRDMILHYLRAWKAAVTRDILFEWPVDDDGQRYRIPRAWDTGISDHIGGIFLLLARSLPFWALSADEKWQRQLLNFGGGHWWRAYRGTEEGRELAKTWKQRLVRWHGDDRLWGLKIPDFEKKWIAGPGRRWRD